MNLALAMLLALGWLPMYACRAENAADAVPFYDFWERFWVRLTPLLVALHVTAACIAISFEPHLPPSRIGASLALFSAGVGIWFWGRVLIGPLRRTRLPQEPPLRFRRDGAFAVVRNPLALGVLLTAAAPLAAAPHPPLFATYAMCALAMGVRVVQEERWMRRHLGDEFARYCERVRRLVPFVW